MDDSLFCILCVTAVCVYAGEYFQKFSTKLVSFKLQFDNVVGGGFPSLQFPLTDRFSVLIDKSLIETYPDEASPN